ncbi:tRNA N(3)-methylcytidine methyltransferase METTL2 isoform X2 [Corythoichthys intestinalis]|uniref:tRNA N(3)-methylcytidine methyltransferase METTL2 isoform X2 n=1 Tax=Corythoichthys intestinalis TaxID=161448 RepID=UPI0025A545D3|nr:tRNA N(3)-methylcytidine methyltransferase METTL2 isoform X2 [Corythoichthys intestinalis]
MAAPCAVACAEAGRESGRVPSPSSAAEEKRPQFGTRFLTDPRQVFQHNAWDNVEWTEEQEAAAKSKVQENSQPLPAEKQGRLWCWQHGFSHPKDEQVRLADVLVTSAFDGSVTTDPGLFVYCCDFSSTAVELVKANPEYDPGRCFAFVCDLSDDGAAYPVPDGSLDVVVLIFVLSALHPDKMRASVSRLARLLKPGGVMLLRDYGRYDMAQLRFKKGRCLSDNFYVRGDGTRVYFFTQDELHDIFSEAGLHKVQNLVDRRLQVNRGKQLTMYRVWIQCKYQRNPEEETTSN